jgi:hypothetical protein
VPVPLSSMTVRGQEEISEVACGPTAWHEMDAWPGDELIRVSRWVSMKKKE